jgi:hypothetical protein
MAGPKEIEAPIPSVEICIHEQCIEEITPTRGFEDYTIELTPELIGNKTESYITLTLKTNPWRPSNWIPNSSDIRELGVRVASIEVR